MATNSTTINKMKNYLSLQIIEHKKIMTPADGNPDPGKNMAELNRLMEYKSSPLIIKDLHRFPFQLKRPYNITKLNDNINMYGTRVSEWSVNWLLARKVYYVTCTVPGSVNDQLTDY